MFSYGLDELTKLPSGYTFIPYAYAIIKELFNWDKIKFYQKILKM